MTKPILHLNLIKHWFDIIGIEKFEEYRNITPYWDRIFRADGMIRIKGNWYKASDIIVCFSNGYSKNRPQKYFEIIGLSVGIGNPKWGAEPGIDYFILEIGKQISI
jgi:hypothetical protein